MQVYLNNASTTKPDKEVLDDFMWCAEKFWHNPSDISMESFSARNIIKTAQKNIADSINAQPKEIIFTSGGSESNNWAIKGYLDRYPGVKTIITTKIEHPSVYNVCKYLSEKGYKIYFAPIDCYGRVDIKRLENLIISNNLLYPFVSIMMANNEIGTLNNIASISKVVHKYGGVLHTDAVQAYMHSPIDVEELGIDMMSTSFHKFGGFKNCGFLYVRNGIELTPLIHGGHQFNSKRSGTENVPMIYAMGNQVEKMNRELSLTMSTFKEVYDYTIAKIYDKCKNCEIYLNGHPSDRLYNNISLTFKGIDANALISLLELKGIYVSAGSACCAGENTPSRVLKEIGLSDEEAFSTIRISINQYTTKEEIDYFVDELSMYIISLQIFG